MLICFAGHELNESLLDTVSDAEMVLMTKPLIIGVLFPGQYNSWGKASTVQVSWREVAEPKYLNSKSTLKMDQFISMCVMFL